MPYLGVGSAGSASLIRCFLCHKKMLNAKPGSGLCDARAPKKYCLDYNSELSSGAFYRAFFSRSLEKVPGMQCQVPGPSKMSESFLTDCTIRFPTRSQEAQRNSAEASFPSLPVLPLFSFLILPYSHPNSRPAHPGPPAGPLAQTSHLVTVPHFPACSVPLRCFLRSSPRRQGLQTCRGCWDRPQQRFRDGRTCDWTHADAPP